jgi:hypothetical protein
MVAMEVIHNLRPGNNGIPFFGQNGILTLLDLAKIYP